MGNSSHTGERSAFAKTRIRTAVLARRRGTAREGEFHASSGTGSIWRRPPLSEQESAEKKS